MGSDLTYCRLLRSVLLVGFVTEILQTTEYCALGGSRAAIAFCLTGSHGQRSLHFSKIPDLTSVG